MTDAGWAWERAIKIWKGFRGGLIDYGTQLLEAEHARAVRIVKAEIRRVKMDQHSYTGGYEKSIACDVLSNILAALQKGRT